MELEVLGVGNAFTARHYNTSFLLRAERWILIDGPQALFRLLLERKIPLEGINDVIVTHVHGDHVSGLETLMLWKKYAEGRRIRLHTTGTVYQDLEQLFFGRLRTTFNGDYTRLVSTELPDYVEFHELAEEGVTAMTPSVSVEVRYNWHPVATLGLKLSCASGVIGISGDTCYRPPLLRQLREQGILSESRYRKLTGDWLWDADVIYHEADRLDPSPHTLEKDLLKLPERVRTKIRLVHFPDDFDERDLPLAREGERVLSENGSLKLVLP